MLEIFNKLIQELSSGRPAVLGTIIRQDGSSPRSLGSRFLVRQDGSIVGSIGGGSLEGRVISAAGDLIGRDVARVMEIRMTGKEVAETDMICGGNVDVLVHAVTPGNANQRRVLEAVLRLLERGGSGILATGPIPETGTEAPVGQLFYQADSKPAGDIPGEPGLADSIRAGADSLLAGGVSKMVDGQSGAVLQEPLYSKPTVIIFGGGHISVNLAPLLAMVDFRVIVVDDRAEFASPLRFPQASDLVVGDFKDCFDRLEFSPETYAVIVTRGHLHDKNVLQAVLDRQVRYVGMIGSRRKRNMIYEALLAEGVEQEQINRVRSPIGLDIAAETPEEIAVSITAELIQVRAENLRLVKDWKV